MVTRSDLALIERNCNTMEKLIVVGIGGGIAPALEIVEHKYKQAAKFLFIDTDASALVYRNVTNKLLIGEEKLFGLGAFNNPVFAKEAAQNSIKEISDYITGFKNVIVVTALGGGTGTGAADVVVQTAKRLGANVVTFVSTPIKHDGSYAKKISEQALESLKNESDLLFVLENDKIAQFPTAGYETAQRMLFRKLNRVYYVIISKMIKELLNNNTVEVWPVIIIWLSRFIDRMIRKKHEWEVRGAKSQICGHNEKFKVLKSWPPSDLLYNLPPWLVRDDSPKK